VLRSGDVIVTLLGHPRLGVAASDAAFPSKGFQLLGLLARAPGHRLPRRTIAALLWDSASDAVGLTNLRQLMRRMRQSAPPVAHLIAASGADLLLTAQGLEEIDACRFDRAAAASALEDQLEAVLQFTGEFMASLDDATQAYWQWLHPERVLLRQRLFATADSVLLEVTRYGRAPRATLDAVAARLLAIAPEREASFRVLIEAYARAGLVQDAERLEGAMRTALASEGLSVTAQTAAMLRRAPARGATAERVIDVSQPRSRLPRVAFLAPEWAQGVDHRALMQVFVEDVANELARCRSFVVLAPHSSFQIGQDRGVPSDPAILRADYAVSGWVRPGPGGGLLSLRMMDCTDSAIVWAGQFPIAAHALVQSFGLMVARVASTLASAVEKDLMARRRRADHEAYLHYLDGMSCLASSDLPKLRRARRAFKQALAIDPSLAPAAARTAQTLYLEWVQLGAADPGLLLTARELARRAVALDANDAVGHWMEGSVALYQRDFGLCADKFAEAETLCPNSADFLIQYADALAHLGFGAEGWARFERAIDLNPLPPEHYWWAGASIAFQQRDYLKAIALCGRLESEDAVLGLLGASYAHLGDQATARRYGDRIKEIFPGSAAIDRSKAVPHRRKEDGAHLIEGLRLAGIY